MYNIYLIDDELRKLPLLTGVLAELESICAIQFADGFNRSFENEVAKLNSEDVNESLIAKSLAQLVNKAILDDFGIILLDLQFSGDFWSELVNAELEKELTEDAQENCDRYYKLLGGGADFNVTSTILGALESGGRRCVIVSTRAIEEHFEMAGKIISSWFFDNVRQESLRSPRAVAAAILKLTNDKWANACFAYENLNKTPSAPESQFFDGRMPHAPSQWECAAILEWRGEFQEGIVGFINSAEMKCSVNFPVPNCCSKYWPIRFLYGRHREKIHISFLALFIAEPLDSISALFGSNIHIRIPRNRSGSFLYSFDVLIVKGFSFGAVVHTGQRLSIELIGIPDDGDVKQACGDLNGDYASYMNFPDGTIRGQGGMSVRAVSQLRSDIGAEGSVVAKECGESVVIMVKVNTRIIRGI